MPTRTQTKVGAARRKTAVPLPPTDRPFQSLSPAQREAVWETFNAPVSRDEGRPPTVQERSQFEAVRARGKATAAKLPRDRPTVGHGTKKVLIPIEQGLLADADAYAKRHGLKRTQLVAHGLRLAMAAPPPSAG